MDYRRTLRQASVVAEVLGEDVYGCDVCDVVAPREGMTTLGGDRETGYGLVAYPAVCVVCSWEDICEWSPSAKEYGPEMDDVMSCYLELV